MKKVPKFTTDIKRHLPKSLLFAKNHAILEKIENMLDEIVYVLSPRKHLKLRIFFVLELPPNPFPEGLILKIAELKEICAQHF